MIMSMMLRPRPLADDIVNDIDNDNLKGFHPQPTVDVNDGEMSMEPLRG